MLTSPYCSKSRKSVTNTGHKITVVCAPSCAGKTSFIDHLSFKSGHLCFGTPACLKDVDDWNYSDAVLAPAFAGRDSTRYVFMQHCVVSRRQFVLMNEFLASIPPSTPVVLFAHHWDDCCAIYDPRVHHIRIIDVADELIAANRAHRGEPPLEENVGHSVGLQALRFDDRRLPAAPGLTVKRTYARTQGEVFLAMASAVAVAIRSGSHGTRGCRPYR